MLSVHETFEQCEESRLQNKIANEIKFFVVKVLSFDHETFEVIPINWVKGPNGVFPRNWEKLEKLNYNKLKIKMVIPGKLIFSD